MNHDRSDNRPENLEVVSTAEHGERHALHDPLEIRRLYEQGLSLPQVGERLGCASSVVLRALRRAGGQTRSLSESQMLPLNNDLIRRLHEGGVRANHIARLLNVSGGAIHPRIKAMALPVHPVGRPSAADIRRAEATIVEVLGVG